MQFRRWLVAATLVLGLATDGSAQIFVPQPIGVPVLIPPSSAVGFAYSGRRVKVGGYFSSGFGVGVAYPYGGGLVVPAVPYGIVENRVTYQFVAPTVILAPRGLAAAPEFDLTGVDLDAGPPPWMEKKAIAKAPADKVPEKPVAAAKIIQPPVVEPEPEVIVKPTKPFDRVPELPDPKADPAEENLRLTSLGLASFRVSDFGWAARWFNQAVAVDPTKARPYFLLAQAYYAMGKYKQAAAAIEDGLRLQPDWPKLPFAIKKDLYAGQEDEWLLQRKWLTDAQAKNPREPAFAFVRAYQMWFDGDRDEAAKLFRQARLIAPDPTFIDLFLKAAPGAVVAAADVAGD